MRRTATAALAAAALVSMTGCLIVSDKDTRYTGAYAAPQDVAQVRIGSTTVAETVAILGEPSERTADHAGNETLHYHWTKRTSDEGAVFLIFAGDSDTTVEQSVHIAFENGVAARKWRE